MNMRTIRYCIKEGLVNIYRNKIMSLASIVIITASLIVFGIFVIVTANLNVNSAELAKQPQMEIFCEDFLEEEDVKHVKETVENHDQVLEVEMISRKDALVRANEMFGDEFRLDEEDMFLPISFILTLNNIEKSEMLANKFSKIPGVEDISYDQQTMDVINTVVTWITYFSLFLMMLLSIASVVIISNTIRIGMSARKKEINIMKYIGATDWFIRWPFVIEGLVIGVIGSVIGFVVVYVLYNWFVESYSHNIQILQFVSINYIAYDLIVFYLILGVLVGVVGSVVSIRKYLKV